ncbi:Nucleoporin seh1 [Intoshia linei]|uniref:Nucleoporin seh1 n=1 Tax=Intoshia linei TaxID=1819745 RepID=A0A177B140_9BILA|nr:Nucleoporin seh1 [Intoshia linei]
MNLKEVELISKHKDIINYVSYDYYGKRMATCSTDHTINIWDVVDAGVDEPLNYELNNTRTQWIKRTDIVDSRSPVVGIDFAHKREGCKLVACAIDGIFRMYECVNPVDLTSWLLKYEVKCDNSCTCISWSASQMHTPLIAVGTTVSNNHFNPTGGVYIYQLKESTKKYQIIKEIPEIKTLVSDIAFASNYGSSYLDLAVASKSLYVIRISTVEDDESINEFTVLKLNNDDVTYNRISWNMMGTILCSSSDDSCVKFWGGECKNVLIKTIKCEHRNDSTDKTIKTVNNFSLSV